MKKMRKAYSIIVLAVCTMTLSPTLMAEDNQEKKDNGYFIGIEGSAATGISTFKTDKMSVQMNLEGGYRFNKWFSLQLGVGGGKMNIGPQSCCSGHPGINNERNSYWRSYSDSNWHYYPEEGVDGWWYADMNGVTTYYKSVVQANFDILSFFTENVGLEISPKAGGMFTTTELDGKSSLTGNNLNLKNESQKHFIYGGETTLSYKFDNGMRVGVFAAVDMLTGNHFDNIPLHVHNENLIWNAGIKFGISLGKRHSKSAPVVAVEAPVAIEKKVEAETEQKQEERVEIIEEVIEKEEEVIAPELPSFATVYFANDSAEISDIQRTAIEDVVRELVKFSGLKIVISGYASNTGSEQYNTILSEKRCNAVKEIIVSGGISEESIETNPCGIDSNAENAEKARRVDIIVIGN